MSSIANHLHVLEIDLKFANNLLISKLPSTIEKGSYMSDLDTNIHGYSQEAAVQGAAYIPSTEVVEEKKVDAGVSSIEKSKAVAALMTPPPNFPMLISPAQNEVPLALIISSLENSSKPIADFMRSIDIKMSEIADQMLDGWLKNIREIQEWVQSLINSPNYQYLQEIRLHGDQKQGNVSGIQDPTSANAAAANPTTANIAPYNFLTALDRLQAFERVHASAPSSDSSTVSNSTSADDAARLVSIPIVAAMIIGGGMALGATELTTSINGMSSSPFVAPVELMERLQPVFPQLVVQDIIPMINLMVATPIYFNALEEAVSNIKERERDNHVETAQNFAKDVVKMVADPAFVMMTYVNKMPGAEQMSPELKERMAAMLKLILASVALSLLYSVDVGKVQSGKYWGMEAQEFRDVLTGKIAGPNPDQKQSTQEQLVATLIKQVNAQLDALPAEQRAEAVETILTYVGGSHNLKTMLDPAQIFADVFNPVDPSKQLEIQPA